MTMPYITVGRADENGKRQVSLVVSNTVLYLEPELARQVAIDLMIHADRIEKKEMWTALKGET